MRKFSSYGPIDTNLHYYAPRDALIERACAQLVDGHYLTVWAPRQAGKTWVMQQAVRRIKKRGDFEVAITTMQSSRGAETAADALEALIENLRYWFNEDLPDVIDWKKLPEIFTAKYFSKPVILILDEFDAMKDKFINRFANEFRTMYIERMAADRISGEKRYLLHGLALIGVRSVLGIENVSGSPFNVQRSLHIPNLTFDEVEGMFKWYERESGQQVEQEVIERLFYETQGQPGLVGWLGELLTETYNKNNPYITLRDFEIAYAAATDELPNNNILNIISKARQEPYKQLVLELFRTNNKIPFRYDDPVTNFLYMNGVIGREIIGETKRYIKFPSPFAQKRLFNYFANELFRIVGQLYDPFDDLSDTITADSLNVRNLLRRYEAYLRQNKDWLLKDAPRRKDLRIYEAVYHFNLYMYLSRFLDSYEAQVLPEFPTGNGQIDLIIRHSGRIYGLELKSYANRREYDKALRQAARYGKQLGLSEIDAAFFVEYVDKANRVKYEAAYSDAESGVTVTPTFVETGSRKE